MKLTCWDVHHALRPHHRQQSKSFTSGSAAGQTLFYLNHPIQYVQVVGVVVAIEDYHENLFLITLDDSSGATLDIVLRKPKRQQQPTRNNHHVPTQTAALNHTNVPDSDSEQDSSTEETKQTLTLLTALAALTIGTTVLAKGTLSHFRQTRQLLLLRMAPLPSTTAELQHIASRTASLRHTLGKPWRVSDSRQRRLRATAESDRSGGGSRAARQRARRLEQAAWERRREKMVQERWEQEEKLRSEKAEEARRDGEQVMLRRPAAAMATAAESGDEKSTLRVRVEENKESR